MRLEVDRREAYRYLGLKGAEPDAATARAVEEALDALDAAAEPRQISRRFPLRRDGDALEIEGLRIASRALARNLDGCAEVFVMAATLGMGPDRLIARAQAAGAMHRAVALQAAAAAMIEAWCDAVNGELREQARQRGMFLRPRFSPGYGDFALECQPGLFRLLGVQRNIGVTLTDTLLMIPTKSVTAVIGIAPRNDACPEDEASPLDEASPRGCTACDRADCAYRAKEGTNHDA